MQTVRRVPATLRRKASGPTGKARAVAAVLGAGALVLIGAAAPAVAADGTWYVDAANGADGTECGVDPGVSACATIGAALDQSVAEDTISVAPGTYTEALAIDSSITLEGSADAVLVSDGSGPALAAQGDGVEVSVTGLTISPDLAGSWYAVVADGGGTVALSQVSIEHQPDATALGSGIRAQNHSSVVLTDSTVLAASSTDDDTGGIRGGVDAINGSDLTITRSTISPAGDGEAAAFFGIMVGELASDPGDPSTLTMTASTVSAGAVANVAILQGSATITDTSIPTSGPAAAVGGYGIVVLDGSLDLSGGEITGHPAGGIGNLGGMGPSGEAQVTVNGTTIAENGTQDDYQSGGIVMRGGSATGSPVESLDVTNTRLIDNSAAILSEGIPTTVTDSEISGGANGIRVADADLAVTDSQLVGDSADALQDNTGIRAVNGGEEPVAVTVTGSDISNYAVGVGVVAAAAEVSDSTIADNSRAGIFVQPDETGGSTAGSLTVSDSEITGSSSPDFGPFGAGMIVSGGAVTATNVTIADNLIGILIADGDVTLTDSSVTGSGANAPADQPLAGVGIAALSGSENAEAQLTVTGSEISGNRAGMALAVPTLVSSSTIAENTWYGITTEASSSTSGPLLTLVSSTMAGNGTAPMPGVDVPPFGLGVAPDTEVLIAGSILASSSTAGACHIEDSVGTVTDGGYNVVSDASCALTEETSLASTDPLLGTLGDHGGPTSTMLPAPDSPAVDLIPVGSTVAGANVPLCAEASSDQRGITRPQGAACDAGAVELEYQAAQIVTESLPDGTVDESYSVTLEAADGAGEPYSWAITEGDLPDGLELDAATGELSGEPTEAGTFEFTVQVDGEGTAEFAVTIAPAEVPPPVITTESLPNGIVGQAYTAPVEATGGEGEPYSWAVTAGDLPAGLELDAATGEIAGEPTEAGTFEFTIEVDGETSADFSVTVLPELVIVTDTLPQGTVGEPYSATLEATGGDGGPYTWGIDSGDLPDGLTLDAEAGEITGTPTAAESYTFTVVVGDPVYKKFTIEVVPAEAEETPPPGETAPPEETPPPGNTAPPGETAPPGDDAPDEPGDETPAPADDSGSDDGELAVSGIDAPWGGLAFAGLALLLGTALLVLRRVGRLDLDA